MLRGDNNPLKLPRSTNVVLIVFLWGGQIILKKLKKMKSLTDLENHLRTIAEAEKNGGILDIKKETMQVLALCNNIRISMINEANLELGVNIDIDQHDNIINKDLIWLVNKLNDREIHPNKDMDLLIKELQEIGLYFNEKWYYDYE